MRLGRSFYQRDALKVASDLLGKELVRKFPNRRIKNKSYAQIDKKRKMTDNGQA